MDHTEIFLDSVHKEKNMVPKIGAEKSNGIRLCQSDMNAPSTEDVDATKHQYGPKKRQYLSRFKDREIYYAYSHLQDLIHTKQGAENQMCASLRNKICGVVPSIILKTVVEFQRTGFL